MNGMDENCATYIAFAATCPKEGTATAPVASVPAASDDTTLRQAILHGRTASAATLTEGLLQTCAPMEIVQGEIIPALDEVGKGFEEKRVYLPQLLMSAEAARAAFERIKAHVLSTKQETAPHFCVVLATVKGDIHDIGKNIVRLLLENYGFGVVDLGKDVPPEAVLDAVRQTGAPLVGLSALMTTTVPAMEETIALLHREAPTCRVMVGGAVLNASYAKAIGADRYCRDAMEAVRYAESLEAKSDTV